MENKQQGPFWGKDSGLGTENQPSEMLKDLVLRWFLERQAPLVLQNGSLPEWFHGFLTRTQTENLLKDRDFGCFLIRLNERSFGYILSYRGKDRCRHFVISCQQNGRYVVSGDTCTHQSLAELISYYQTSEIEPFGENLTIACTKLEEKSIYDEISLDQQTSLKQNSAATDPVLTRQTSSGSSTPRPTKENSSHQPAEPRKNLPEQQKSLSKEKRTPSPEDPDVAPPIPDRSRLLALDSSEEGFDVEGSIVYAALKKCHLDNRSMERQTDPGKTFTDSSQKPEEPGQVSSSSFKNKASTIFAWTKQPDNAYSKKINQIGTAHSETIYSEIATDQGKNCLTIPDLHSGQSFLMPSKKATLSSPTSIPLKLSPKLPTKPKASTELRGSQSPFAMYAASLMVGEGHQKPNRAKALPDLHRGPTYGQINKMKSQPSTASPCDDTTYEQIPFGWLKSITHKLDSEKFPKSSSVKSEETYDQISAKTGWPPKTQLYTENPYEKIPDHFSKRLLAARHVPTAENTYEHIPFGLKKITEAKPNQKSDKPRKFLFADKKTKF